MYIYRYIMCVPTSNMYTYILHIIAYVMIGMT